MTLSPAALLAELLEDPKHIGYSGSMPAGIAILLNTPGLSNETCPNTAVEMADLMLAIDPTEWDGLSDTRRQLLVTIALKLETIDLSNPAVEARLPQYFAPTGPTVAVLATLRTRPCSRYEALTEPGVRATTLDVNAAIAVNGGISP